MKHQSCGFLALAGLCSANHKLCGQFDNFNGENYTFNNDVWNKDSSGSICTYVSENPSQSSNSFSALWEWTSNPPVVHAFPNVQYNSGLLPLVFSNLTSLQIAVVWSLAPVSLIPGASGNPDSEPDAGALKAVDIQANVVIDLFADTDPITAQTPAKQTYEIMIWIGQFGDAARPIGYNEAGDSPVRVVLSGKEFTLYSGTNGNGQTVFSWVTNDTITSFNADIAPLILFFPQYGYVPSDVYLGTIQFGTETFFASSQINFTVNQFSASLASTSFSTNGSSGTNNPSQTTTAQPIPTVSSLGDVRLKAPSLPCLFSVDRCGLWLLVLAICYFSWC